MMAKLPKEVLANGVICSSAGNHAQGVALAAKKLGCHAVIVMPLTTLVIAGQGTIGMEIMRQLQAPIHAIFVPVGGGGLIAGVAANVKRVSPQVLLVNLSFAISTSMNFCNHLPKSLAQVRIIGVEPVDANAMALSLHHGKRVKRMALP